MNDLLPTESTNVIIGVCGEQASGKTTFLTCVFQSIWTAYPDDVVLGFDRYEVGNADRFQSIEEQLIREGDVAGTEANHLFPARIYVKPYEPLPDAAPPVLSVDLQDFAGRHFRSLANLKVLETPGTLEPEEAQALRTVSETLQKADAFIILINATEIDPLDDTPRRNPFSPSVNFMLSHCRAEGIPVALLFSQIDQTPRLTEEVFRSLPRVQAFERQFTSDLDEAARRVRPFGIVKRIACYQTIEGDKVPIRQTQDGNIWRPEPAKVVLELIRAAMPRIIERLRQAGQHRRFVEEQQYRAEQRSRVFRWAAAAAMLIIVLVGAGMWKLYRESRRDLRKVEQLADVETRISAGNMASISRESETALRDILDAYRADRGSASSAMRSSIRNLHAAFAEAAQRLANEPSLEPAYSAELSRFRSLAPLVDPESMAEWRQTVMSVLEARSTFLSEWFESERKGEERTLALESAIRQFSTGDEVFARVLASQSSAPQPQPAAVNRQTSIAPWREDLMHGQSRLVAV